MNFNLDKNENPFSIPGEIRGAILEKISKLPFNRYPDHDYCVLKRILAGGAGLPPESVVTGNGGDEILWMVFSRYVRPGDTVLTFSPTFSEYYRLSRLFGARHLALHIDLEQDEPVFPAEFFLQTIGREKPSLILIDTPNNPTGKTLPSSFIGEVIARSESPVVVDEAYGEFAESTFLPFLSGKALPDRVIVLKTLSKAWGMAGVRFGWAYCGASAAAGLEETRSPFNVSIFSAAAAEVILEHPEFSAFSAGRVKNLREKVREHIQSFEGWRAFKSDGNFLLLRVPIAEESLRRAADGLFCFKFFDLTPEMKDERCWIRLTIGTEDEMSEVLSFFSSFQK
jgi:histidinol-phosphate aminotransferase